MIVNCIDKHDLVIISYISSVKNIGLKVKHQVAPGKSLFSDLPCSAVVDDQSSKFICHHCFCYLNSENRTRCSVCKYVHYCSRKCQLDDWKIAHKTECQSLLNHFNSNNNKYPSTIVRLSGRIFMTLEPKRIKQLLKDLESNRDNFEEERLEDFARKTIEIKKYLSLSKKDEGFSSRDFIRLLCIITSNSYAICDEEMVNIGIGLYPLMSKVNHSCDPNTSAHFIGKEFELRAIRTIEKDEEICVSYIEVALPFQVRSKYLKDTYCFKCECKRCLTEATEQTSMMHSMKCQKCGSYAVSLNEFSELESTRCTNCTARIDVKAFDEFNSVQNACKINIAKDTCKTSKGIPVYSSLLSKAKEIGLSPSHYVLLKLKKELIYSYVNTSADPSSANYKGALALILELDQFNTDHMNLNPLTAINKYMGAKILIWRNDKESLQKCSEMAMAAYQILKITYGASSKLVEEIALFINETMCMLNI